MAESARVGCGAPLKPRSRSLAHSLCPQTPTMRPSSRSSIGVLWVSLVPIALLSTTKGAQGQSLEPQATSARPAEAFSPLTAASQVQHAPTHTRSPYVAAPSVVSEAIVLVESVPEGRDEGSEEGEGQDGGTSEGDQSDLVSSTPLDAGKRRASILTILLTM